MSTDYKQKIEELLQPLLENDKFFVVDIKVSMSRINSKVTVLLDSDEGIMIDQCSEISRKLGKDLDEIMPDKYTLEVSSPGIDFPLKSERMYLKNVGRTLKVVLNDGKEMKGKLEGLANREITIIEDKKRTGKAKNEPVEPVIISLDNIKEAQVVISFK
ncbi:MULTISPECIES: ribosome maturation factor RimP [Emticicia]|uniref:ribosome maturation factor RimP n=1 Tax=Emticicia TaxID=312278 RepID=UPI000C774D37|nr:MULTISPECIES: ribosome maturation factor RimP [Emticicia]PLK42281.1 ribosome assembly cofactor RimP [Emticicia sp. TH156]UTA69849.1 ribosome maturation factor RimP [Emticicia sp. 21SJ11W-3]